MVQRAKNERLQQKRKQSKKRSFKNLEGRPDVTRSVCAAEKKKKERRKRNALRGLRNVSLLHGTWHRNFLGVFPSAQFQWVPKSFSLIFAVFPCVSRQAVTFFLHHMCHTVREIFKTERYMHK
jgi:hypothetical protein